MIACAKNVAVAIVLYRRVSRLFHELALAHADGSYTRLLAKLAKTDVLVLDDWGHADVGPRERRVLSEIMDGRYGLRSTIITSQMPTTKWHDHLGDPTTANAICDRILSNAHRPITSRGRKQPHELTALTPASLRSDPQCRPRGVHDERYE